MNPPIIFGRKEPEILNHVGAALLQVRNARRLTHLQMAKVMGLKGDDMIGKYILGHAEMGIVAFALALNAWPELADKLNGVKA